MLCHKPLKILFALGIAVGSTLVVGAGVAAAAPDTPPDPPTGVSTSTLSTGVTVSWSASTNAGTDGSGATANITGYNVYVSTTAGAESAPASCFSAFPGTSCDVTGLTPGTQYFFDVTSVNSGSSGFNESAPSPESSFVFVPTPNVTLSASPSSATNLSNVTLSATLDLPATGTVDFVVNGSDVGCAAQSVNASVAICNYTPVSETSLSVNASFSSNNGAYGSASGQITVPVGKAPQTPLGVTSTTGTFGTSISLTASGGSGTGALSFATSPGTASNCLGSGVGESTLTATTAGNCSVIATQASDGNYSVQNSAPTIVTFIKANQLPLVVTSVSGVAGQPLTLTTSGGSGTGTLSYIPTSGTASGCAVNGTSLTVNTTGTCSVTATKASDGNYLPKSSSATVVLFYESAQAQVTVTSTSGTYGSPISLAASGGSGTGALSYGAVNGTASGCLVAGATLTASSAGTCLVTAVKGADITYAPKSSLATAVTFARATQPRLTITSTSGTYRSASHLTVKGGAGSGAVSYVVLSGSAINCRITGSTLSANGAGQCLLRATKAADLDYVSMSSSNATFTFARAHQKLLSLKSTSGTYGSPVSLRTRGGSGRGRVSYVERNGTARNCRIVKFSLTASTAGTCLVRATKARDANYLAASSHLTAVSFDKAAQVPLRLTSTQGTFGQATQLSASGGSGNGPLTYKVANLTASGCTITQDYGHQLLSVTSPGTCLVKVLKAADRNHRSASSPSTPVVFTRASQAALVIVTSQGTIGSSVRLVVHGGSGSGREFFSVADGTAARCAISGGLLVASTAGTCRVTVAKYGDPSHVGTRSPTKIITFLRFNQAHFALVPARGTVGSGISLTTTGGSGAGVVSFVLRGGTSSTCVLNGSTLVSTSIGTCRVRAAKKGDGAYRAVTSSVVTFTFTHKPAVKVLSVSPTSDLKAGDEVRVAGSGFTPHQQVVIAECMVGAGNLSQCDRVTAKTVVVGASGVLPTTSVVMATGRIGHGTCGTSPTNLSSCELHVSNAAFGTANIVALHFVHVVSGRSFRVTPSKGLKNGEVITLSGEGFTPNDRVFYAECLEGSITEARCDLSTYKSVIISPAGVFPATKLKLVAGAIGPGTCGTTSSDANACDISVANSSLGDAAVANLTFITP